MVKIPFFWQDIRWRWKISKLDLLSNDQFVEKPVIQDKDGKYNGNICSKN